MKYVIGCFRKSDGQLELTNNYTRRFEAVTNLSFWGCVEYENSDDYSEVVIVCIEDE